MPQPVLAENQRLAQHRDRSVDWKLWGPYLSDRAWGTVREDYSAGGAAWDYLPHDHARSRAYRWSEDGLLGICDRRQNLCLALGLWNERDPILKERLFGLGGPEGNHGEDVKEYYFYLDSTPTHSYMKALYKYPQAAFPYGWLVDENRTRGRLAPEFELMDTGVFNDDRYFDVFAEYAKAGVSDVLLRLTLINRGPDPAPLHILPQVWFRNTWSWGMDWLEKPELHAEGPASLQANTKHLPGQWVYFDAAVPEGGQSVS
ncbi:MAG: glucosidase, partial [Anaerolineales bacterium]